MFQDHYDQVIMAKDASTPFKYVLLYTVMGPKWQVFKSNSPESIDVLRNHIMWFATFYEDDYIFYDENGTRHDGTFWNHLVYLDEYRTGYRFESEGNIVYVIFERILTCAIFNENENHIQCFTQMLCDQILVEDRYQLLLSCLVDLEDIPNQTSNLDSFEFQLLNAACNVIHENLKELDANFYYINLRHETRLKYGLNFGSCNKMWLQCKFGGCFAKQMQYTLPRLILQDCILKENAEKTKRYSIE